MAQASKTFRIFVSSTFSDLKEERNVLFFPNPRSPGTKISRMTVTAICSGEVWVVARIRI